jgi:hypothetical protein
LNSKANSSSRAQQDQALAVDGYSFLWYLLCYIISQEGMTGKSNKVTEEKNEGEGGKNVNFLHARSLYYP